MTGKVLVTGGAGFIGSHTCRALAAAGYLPITLDNLGTGRREAVQWGPLVYADIRNTEAVAAALREHDIEAVMHFAAHADVGESMIDPAKYYQTNVAGTLSVLEAMRQTGVKLIVFSSSCAVYGTPPTTRVSETTPTLPISPYGRSKLICEMILQDYAAAYGLHHSCLRYFNASGATAEYGLGETRANAIRLIPRLILYALDELPDFQVHGTDYPTRDGTAIRDYIHVRDLADAHVLALRHLCKSSVRTFNIGIGAGYTIMEVLAAVSQISGLNLRPSFGQRRPGDPAEIVADATLAREVLGFRPERSDLKNIIRTTWAWLSTAPSARVSREEP